MLVALNKIDVSSAADYLPDIERNLEQAGYRYFRISAVTGEGIDPLLFAIDAILSEQEDAAEAKAPQPEVIVVRPHRRYLEITLIDEGLWEITGSGIERLLAMTDLKNEEAVERLQQSLKRMGVFATLKERGVKEGDHVRISGVDLDYVD